ncbi:UDP-N-acetylmuramoyl-tripeptide--D-alanyl-D-alanine ligase [Kistimonas asteriae]|uniref:UDP-N-acetylmuramoyl-tripeptide--D-alanyl-D- alanine ligase n=1 Tax=Kistimonas asteriae TaxID=517724 RepID=UPI001BAE09DC|nr:UDP-N-acetylmuramoyl-tripeptide--D-alanyl-D-alanine ligase [Kistimonas asteriae]
MINAALSDLVQPLTAELIGDDACFSDISIDTRTLKPGQLFVAITGPHFDGHDYVAAALEKGAAGAVVSSQPEGVKGALLLVADTRIALGQIGAFNRQRFNGVVMGVTGSSGKTSTREMIAAICREVGETLATEGNLNNDFGVPVILSRLEECHQYAVIEMGTNHPGEIDYVARLAAADIALITNASEAHLSGLGSLAGVVVEKGAIFDSLPVDGTAILNADDPACGEWLERIRQQPARKVLRFSLTNQQADCYTSEIHSLDDGMHFILHMGSESAHVHLQFWGEHQVANACAAAAVAQAAGLSLNTIVQGLEKAQPYMRRGQRFHGQNGALVIDESYNANPASTRAAIDVLAACQGEKILVLGDMAELGDQVEIEHCLMGQYARDAGIDVLMTYGEYTQLTQENWGGAGAHFPAKTLLIDDLLSRLGAGVAVMVKGSMSMGMNEVVRACKKPEEGNR